MELKGYKKTKDKRQKSQDKSEKVKGLRLKEKVISHGTAPKERTVCRTNDTSLLYAPEQVPKLNNQICTGAEVTEIKINYG